MKTDTLIKLAVLIVSITVSHMSLKADFRVLKATTELQHKHVMEELSDIKLATTGRPLRDYVDKTDTPSAKKKKKIYVVDDLWLPLDQNIEAY